MELSFEQPAAIIRYSTVEIDENKTYGSSPDARHRGCRKAGVIKILSTEKRKIDVEEYPDFLSLFFGWRLSVLSFVYLDIALLRTV